MMPDDITPVILTFDEAPNIRATLEGLLWARRIVVLDSFSTDETEAIARSFPNVDFQQRRFDSHTDQWNHALSLAETDWVLSLDADYLVPPEFTNEVGSRADSQTTAAYFARFEYRILGHALRGTLYPNRAVLFRRSACRYEQDGHTQVLRIAGPSAILDTVIAHDDRKPVCRWLQAQDRYATLEVAKLVTTRRESLRMQDRLRLRIVPAPFVVLLYTLLWRRSLLDGWPGWLYAFQRMVAELILSMHLIERKLSRKSPDPKGEPSSHA
jgi:glycosyltransferase involved in cell wall biosynthesis